MPDLNQCSFTGRLGRDAETRDFGENTVANFSIAIDASYKPKGGDKVEKTVWLDCAAWNGLARVVSKYTNRGSRVAVSGPLELDEWEKDGQKRSKHKLRVNSLVLLDSKSDGNGSGNNSGGGGGQRQPAGQQDDDFDQIPF